MATTIRLTRMGKKKRPFYRLVVLDSRKRRDGAYLANLGYYNPFVEPHEVRLHEEEILAWLKKGATISGTVRALLKAQGVLLKHSLVRQGLGEDEVAARMGEWQEGADRRTARREQVRSDQERQVAEARKKAEAENAEYLKAQVEKAQAEQAAEQASAAAADPTGGGEPATEEGAADPPQSES